MKRTKKIIAALLAVMMLALTIPFTASAVEPSYTATITGKTGYGITIYQLGSVEDDGTYKGVTDNTTIDTAINALNTTAKQSGSYTIPASFRTTLDAMNKADLSSFAVEGNVDKVFGATPTYTFTTSTEGIYYAKVTVTPAGKSVKSTGGSVFMLGESNKTAEADISGKIADDTVTVTKTFADGTTKKSVNIGDEVEFKLTASVTGSAAEPLTEYTIHDSMSTGVDYVRVASVKLDDTTNLVANTDYTVDAGNKTDIKIALDVDKVADKGFYSASNVVVILVGKLNANAAKGRDTKDEQTSYYLDGNTTSDPVNNFNRDSLTFTNKFNVQSDIKGNTVHLYTFDLPVVKVDANNSTKLPGAKFTLYTDEGCTTVATNGATQTTDANGKVTFKGLKSGTYYLKETEAPAGYNLNSTVFTIVIAEDGKITSNGTDVTDTEVSVGDTPIFMPATGGTGTMVFTIVGASLIACAGILLVVVKRRKASK